MKFLKSLGVSLLGLILFFSLSAFGAAFTMQRTVMDRGFIAAELSLLDIAGLLKETIAPQITQQLTQQIGQAMPGARERVAGVMDTTIAELDPWMKKQTTDLALSLHDYVTGRSQSLNLTIPLETLRDTLAKNVRTAVTQAPEMAQVPAAQRDAMVAGLVGSLTQQIPATFDLGQSLGTDFRKTIEDARRGAGYFNAAYWGLVALILVSAGGIVLILRDTRAASRNLGTTFLTFGAFEYGGILVTRYFVVGQFSEFAGLPSALQKWLPRLLNDVMAPLEAFSIAVGVLGLLLIVASFFIRRKPRATASPQP